MKKLILLALALCISVNAYAFGGGGKGRASTHYKNGVSAYGIHYGGGGSPDIHFRDCDDQTETWTGECCPNSLVYIENETEKCCNDAGHELVGDNCREKCPSGLARVGEDCVDLCEGFTESDCAHSCDPAKGPDFEPSSTVCDDNKHCSGVDAKCVCDTTQVVDACPTNGKCEQCADDVGDYILFTGCYNNLYYNFANKSCEAKCSLVTEYDEGCYTCTENGTASPTIQFNNGDSCGAEKVCQGGICGWTDCADPHATRNGSNVCECAAGYYGDGNTCTVCPANASCPGGTTFTCNENYKKEGDVCALDACIEIRNNYSACLDTCTSTGGVANATYKTTCGEHDEWSCDADTHVCENPCVGQTPTGCVKSLKAQGGSCVPDQYYVASDHYICDTNKECDDNHECSCTGYMKGSVCTVCPLNATCDGTDFTCADNFKKVGDGCEQICPEGTSLTGLGEESNVVGCYCKVASSTWNVTQNECECPNADEVFVTVGDETLCKKKCNDDQTRVGWDCVCSNSDYEYIEGLNACVAQCKPDQFRNDSYVCVCPDGGELSGDVCCNTTTKFAWGGESYNKVDPTSCGCPDEFTESNGTCASCSTADMPRFVATDGKCRKCDVNDPYAVPEASRCTVCGAKWRRFVAGTSMCVRNTCGEGAFYDTDGNCYPCTTDSTPETTSGACGLCEEPNARSWITLETGEQVCMKECDEGFFHDWLGGCQRCDDDYGHHTDEEESNRCEDPKRIYSNGVSHLCTVSAAMTSTKAQCDHCGELRIWNPNYSEGQCLRACDPGNFHDYNAQCLDCTLTTPIQTIEAESDACSNRFFGTDGKSYLCNTIDVVAATEEQCTRCTGTETGGKRKMTADGKCIYDCGENSFYSNSKQCKSCDVGSATNYSNASSIETSQEESNLCPNRFWSTNASCGTYCSGTLSIRCDQENAGGYVRNVSEEECARCKDENGQRTRVRLVKDNVPYCFQICQDGFLRTSGGACVNCATTTSTDLWANDDTECARCVDENNQPTHGVFYANIDGTGAKTCKKLGCNPNNFQLFNGTCEACSKTGLVSAGVGSNDSERRASVLASCNYENAPNPRLVLADGTSYSCTYGSAVAMADGNLCESSCSNREYIDGSCYLKCGDTQFRGLDTNCYECSLAGSVLASRTENNKCGATTKVNRRFWSSNARTGSGSTDFADSVSISCASTKKGEYVHNVTGTQCARCVDENNNQLRRMIINTSICALDCPNGFYDSNEGCADCETAPYDTVPYNGQECLSCKDANNKSIRAMFNGHCAKKGCDTNYFQDTNGSCVGCNTSDIRAAYSWSEVETNCNYEGSTNRRFLTSDDKTALCSNPGLVAPKNWSDVVAICNYEGSSTKRFLTSDDKTALCSYTELVAAKNWSDVVAMCNYEGSTNKRFLSSSGVTALCSYSQGVNVSSEADCTDYCTNRDYADGMCYIRCENGFRENNGTCHSCAEDSGAVQVSSEAACLNACPTRYYENGRCYPRACTPEVEFRPHDNAGCVSCSSDTNVSGYIYTDEAHNNLCPNRFLANVSAGGWGESYLCTSSVTTAVTTKAQCDRCANRMWRTGEYCIITACAATNQFKEIGGACYPCSDNTARTVADTSDCETACPGRKLVTVNDTIKCELRVCPDGTFRQESTRNCASCHSTAPVNLNEVNQCMGTSDAWFMDANDGIHRCTDASTYVTASEYMCTGYCPSRFFDPSTNKCYYEECTLGEKMRNQSSEKCEACNSTSAIRTTKTESDACGGRFFSPDPDDPENGTSVICSSTALNYATNVTQCNNCPNRVMIDGYCVPKCTKAEGQNEGTFHKEDRSCVSCTTQTPVKVFEPEECGTRYCNAGKRVMQGDYCVLANCNGTDNTGYFHDDTKGACNACSANNYNQEVSGANASECLACGGRELFNNGTANLCAKECNGATQFHNINGGCDLCSSTAAIYSTMDEVSNTCAHTRFMTTSGATYLCSTTTALAVDTDNQEVLDLLENCNPPRFIDTTGKSYVCTQASAVIVGDDATAQDLCTKCVDENNRHRTIFYNGTTNVCVKQCDGGFYHDTSSSCRDCSISTAYATTATELAMTCGNTRFLGKDGKAYLCTAGIVDIDADDSAAVNLCTGCVDENNRHRVVFNNGTKSMCVKQCDSGFYHDASGTCRDCSIATAYATTATELLNQCGHTRFLGSDNKAYLCSHTSGVTVNLQDVTAMSMFESCDTPRFVVSTTSTTVNSYACAYSGAVAISETDTDAINSCTACPGRTYDTNTKKCVLQ